MLAGEKDRKYRCTRVPEFLGTRSHRGNQQELGEAQWNEGTLAIGLPSLFSQKEDFFLLDFFMRRV